MGSEEQKGGMAEIFPSFPQSRVIVAPNGINVEKFKLLLSRHGSLSGQQQSRVKRIVRNTNRLSRSLEKRPNGSDRPPCFTQQLSTNKPFQTLSRYASAGPDEEMKKVTDLAEKLGL